MMCIHQDMEWRLYPMMRYFGQMYGPFHHVPYNLPCSLYLLYTRYNYFLELATQNMLEYHMCWWQSLDIYCLLSEFIALVLWSGSRICYNMNCTGKPLLLGPQKMMRDPSYLTVLCSFLVLILINFFYSMSIRSLWAVTSIPESLSNELRSSRRSINLSYDSSSAWKSSKNLNNL